MASLREDVADSYEDGEEDVMGRKLEDYQFNMA